jgi:hypothetical protein
MKTNVFPHQGRFFQVCQPVRFCHRWEQAPVSVPQAALPGPDLVSVLPAALLEPDRASALEAGLPGWGWVSGPRAASSGPDRVFALHAASLAPGRGSDSPAEPQLGRTPAPEAELPEWGRVSAPHGA